MIVDIMVRLCSSGCSWPAPSVPPSPSPSLLGNSHTLIALIGIFFSKISSQMKPYGADKVAVVVGTVTDDLRLLKVPKIQVCALRVTESARARIVKAGGQILTFDQLALRAPTGANTVLLQGLLAVSLGIIHFFCQANLRSS